MPRQPRVAPHLSVSTGIQLILRRRNSDASASSSSPQASRSSSVETLTHSSAGETAHAFHQAMRSTHSCSLARFQAVSVCRACSGETASRLSRRIPGTSWMSGMGRLPGFPWAETSRTVPSSSTESTRASCGVSLWYAHLRLLRRRAACSPHISKVVALLHRLSEWSSNAITLSRNPHVSHRREA